jgi:predicted RecA/RadA family phage recombinase
MTMAYARGGKPRFVNYNPGGTVVNAGDVVVVGDLPCVAHSAIPQFTGGPTQNALAVGGGLYEMTADASYPIGTRVMWDPTQSKVTASGTASASAVDFGWIVGAPNGLTDAAGTDVLVMHEPVVAASALTYSIGSTTNDNITNTNAETAFATTAIIPAATLEAGDIVNVKAVVLVSAQNSTNTNDVKLKLTTAANTFTALIDCGAKNLAANALVVIEADLQFTAVGNSGSVTTMGTVLANDAAGATATPKYTSATNCNTSLALTIEVTDTQSAASASNVAQLLELNATRKRK